MKKKVTKVPNVFFVTVFFDGITQAFIFCQLVLFFMISSCTLPGPQSSPTKKIVGTNGGATGENAFNPPGEGVNAEVLSDEGGVTKSKIDPNAKTYQILKASSTSNLGQSQVTLAPGSLAIPAEISLEEGASILTEELSGVLGADLTNSTSASKPLVVTNSANVDAINPFAISLPVGGTSLFSLTENDANLVIIFKVVKVSENNTVFTGVIPRGELKVENNIVTIWTKYFGSYQLVFVPKPIVKKIEQPTTGLILTKKLESQLPELKMGAIKFFFNSTESKVIAEGSLLEQGQAKIGSCIFQSDSDKVYPFDYQLTQDNPVFSLVPYTEEEQYVYARIICGVSDGRTASSPWSEALLVPGKRMGVPEVSELVLQNGALSVASTNISVKISSYTAHLKAYRLGMGSDCSSASWIPWIDGLVSFGLSGGDGTKIVCAQIQDKFGRLSKTVSSSILLASIPISLPPSSFSLKNPASSPANVQSPTITVGQVEVGSKIRIYTDANCTTMVGESIAVSSSVDITITNLASEGTYTFYGKNIDAAGIASSCSSSNLSYVLDTTLPTVTLTSPGQNSYIIAANANNFIVSGACSENGRNINISGSVTQSTICVNGSFATAMDLSGLNDGNITINVSHQDAAGNQSSLASVTIPKDATPPPNFSAISVQAGVTTASIDFSYTLPSIVGDFSLIEVREYLAGTIVGDCSGGMIIHTVNTFAPNNPIQFTKVYSKANQAYDFRFCVSDAHGNINFAQTALDVSTQSFNLSQVKTGKFFSGVDIEGNYAYILEDNSLGKVDIIDISTEASPIYKGSIGVGPYPKDIDVVVTGGIVRGYVAAYTNGLKILDLSDPNAPSVLGTYAPAGATIWDVKVVGTTAYLAFSKVSPVVTSGVYIVDISSPSTPGLLGSWTGGTTNNQGMGIDINGSILYLADGSSGVRIISISSPASPSLISTFDTAGTASSVRFQSNYLFVADGFSGLQIVNVLSPGSPTLTKNVMGVTAYKVEVDSNYAYIGSNTNNGGLTIVDISTLATASVASTYTEGGLYTADIKVIGSRVYVADGSSGLVILNTGAPASPVSPLFVTAAKNDVGSGYQVAASGNYAYIADLSGISIMDISDASNPIYKTSFRTNGYARAVAVSGNYAYVGANFPHSLKVVNIQDPLNPGLVGNIAMPSYVYNIRISGNYVYTSEGNAGMRIVDITDPASPIIKGTYNTPGTVNDLAIEGNYAYLADNSNGLVILDISNPLSPTLASTFTLGSGFATAVAVKDSVAYLSISGSGVIKVIDCQDKATPNLIKDINAAFAWQMQISGNYLYGINGTSLGIYDISIPSASVSVSSYNSFSTDNRSIFVSGNYAHVTSYQGAYYLMKSLPNP